eukprot:TRINITY_DN911_c0_g1_i2.p2 TRINITY_DN911_c0_g1~~TRINITY_DN911_c0_g1_i2.p2  ORF type:complete len:130 (+),score=39.32 TRINITY_DN911_c0_g1_i2:279-668(+)
MMYFWLQRTEKGENQKGWLKSEVSAPVDLADREQRVELLGFSNKSVNGETSFLKEFAPLMTPLDSVPTRDELRSFMAPHDEIKAKLTPGVMSELVQGSVDELETLTKKLTLDEIFNSLMNDNFERYTKV